MSLDSMESEEPMPMVRPQRLIQQIIAYRTSQCIRVVVELGIPALLEQGSRSVEDLAASTKTDSTLLTRILHHLVNEEVLGKDAEGRYTHTPSSRFLIPGHEHSLHHWVSCELHPGYWRAWEQIGEQLRTGVPAFQLAHGEAFFQWLAGDPAAQRRFDDAMSSASLEMGKAVAMQLDFASGTVIVDVGGGDGSFLALLLTRSPGSHGVLFELPRVAGSLSPEFEQLVAAGRATVQHGSFMDAIPAGGDVYIFSRVFHDFGDDVVDKALRNARCAMSGHERLFVIDMLLERTRPANKGASLDILMMVLLGGRERSRDEFSKLLAQAGFETVAVTPTNCPLSILEARYATA